MSGEIAMQVLMHGRVRTLIGMLGWVWAEELARRGIGTLGVIEAGV